MASLSRYWVRVKGTRLCGPVFTVLGASWLLYHLLTSDYYAFSGGGKGYGPLSWPEFALLMLIGAGVLLCACRGWSCMVRTRSGTTDAADVPDDVPKEDCNNRRVAVGGWLILLFGVGFVYIGFLFSSVLFLLAWLLVEGMRNPLKLASISVLGTLAPLYLLVKVAYMPLPRGYGPFETATVWLYGALGLF